MPAEGDGWVSRPGESGWNCRRDLSLAGRYGGEEFCLLPPNTDVKQALGNRRDGARGGAEYGDASLHPDLSDRQRRRSLHQRHPAPGRSERSRGCRAVCRQACGRNAMVADRFERLSDEGGLALAS